MAARQRNYSTTFRVFDVVAMQPAYKEAITKQSKQRNGEAKEAKALQVLFPFLMETHSRLHGRCRYRSAQPLPADPLLPRLFLFPRSAAARLRLRADLDPRVLAFFAAQPTPPGPTAAAAAAADGIFLLLVRLRLPIGGLAPLILVAAAVVVRDEPAPAADVVGSEVCEKENDKEKKKEDEMKRKRGNTRGEG